jgi:hypothetical protein
MNEVVLAALGAVLGIGGLLCFIYTLRHPLD